MLEFTSSIMADANQMLQDYFLQYKAAEAMKMKEAVVGYIVTGFTYLAGAGLIFMIGSLAAEMGRSLASAGSTAWNLTKKGAGAVIGGAKGVAHGVDEASIAGQSTAKTTLKRGYEGAVTGFDVGLGSIFKSPIQDRLSNPSVTAVKTDGTPMTEKELFSPTQSLGFLTGGPGSLKSLEIRNPDRIPAGKLSAAFNKVATDGTVKLHGKDTVVYIRRGVNFVSADGHQSFSPEDLARVYGRLK